MFSISAKLVQRPPTAGKILKQLNYGLAVGLTKTAKEAQAEVIRTIKSDTGWQERTSWTKSPIGIKITPATPQSLRAEVKTKASFLPLHEEGGTKFPLRNYLAVPTQFARPNPGSRIRSENKPKALIASGKAAIVENDNGTKVLYAHKGPRNGWVPMYILTPKAKIKRADIWQKPIEKVLKRRLHANIEREQRIALAKIR